MIVPKIQTIFWTQIYVGIGYVRPRLAGALINFFSVWPLVPVLLRGLEEREMVSQDIALAV